MKNPTNYAFTPVLVDGARIPFLKSSTDYKHMHRVSSSSIALPTDLWYPVTEDVKPQFSHQVSVGYTRIFPEEEISVTVEGYYKSLENLIEYREGASLILNDNFEQELLAGKGESYGLEILARKNSGFVTGWISYSISKTTRNFDELNNGRTYPAKYDRRHVANMQCVKPATGLIYSFRDEICREAVAKLMIMNCPSLACTVIIVTR